MKTLRKFAVNVVTPVKYGAVVLLALMSLLCGACVSDASPAADLHPGISPTANDDVRHQDVVEIEDTEDMIPSKAVDFDGSESYLETGVNAGDLGIEGNAQRTVEAWVYTREFRENAAVFSLGERWSSTGEDFSLLALGTEDRWRMVLWSTDLDFFYPSKDRWVHFACVYTGSDMVIYADGEEVAWAGREIDTSTEEPFRIGHWDDEIGNVFDGMIAEVRVWDRALTDEEINARMGVTLEGNEKGLAGYWPLSEADEDGTAPDLARGNAASPVGEPKWVLTRPFKKDLPETMDIDPDYTTVLGPVELKDPAGEVQYRWYFNDEPIEGAHENTLVIEDITPKELGTYYVRVDDDRPLTPVESTRTVLSDWPIWQNDLREGAFVNQGESAVLGPVELYAPVGEVIYQWYHNDVPIEGANESALHLENITGDELGFYYVVADDESHDTPAESSRVLVQPPCRWERNINTTLTAAPVIGEGGMLYAGGADGVLYAFSSEDGSKIWTVEVGGAIVSSPDLCPDDEIIYVAGREGKLYAVGKEGGEVMWTFETGAAILSSPVVAEDGAVYVGNNEGRAYAVNSDGTEKWSYETGGAVVPGAAVCGSGGVYVGSYDGMLYALDPADGSQLWSTEIGGTVMSAPAAGDSGIVYVGGGDGLLYALNAEDGSVAWTFETGARIRSAPAFGPDGTVYAGSLDGSLYCVNKSDGTEIWAFKTEGEFASLTVSGARGTAYAINTDGRLYALDEGNGTLQWSFISERQLRTASPAAGEDTIYFVSYEGYIYAIAKFHKQ